MLSKRFADSKARPKTYSKTGFLLGSYYFTWRRYLVWLVNRSAYAEKKPESLLPYAVCQHKTPLLRRLRNVDMWLQHNKIINLTLACDRINGVVIRPGETFSFWRLVGKPTRRKGYVDGMVLFNGSFHPGLGGGLCQLSNLIYWMTLHTPLTVTERWRHNYDVFPDADRKQPFGSGATIAYNYIDLQVRNDTDCAYQLAVSVGDRYLHGQWRSAEPKAGWYQVYESSHRITQQWGLYLRHNVLRRKVFDRDNNQIDDEFLTENHAVMMYNPLLADKSATPSATMPRDSRETCSPG